MQKVSLVFLGRACRQHCISRRPGHDLHGIATNEKKYGAGSTARKSGQGQCGGNVSAGPIEAAFGAVQGADCKIWKNFELKC